MAGDLFRELIAPNGRRFQQPIGLWINNEWVAAKSGKFVDVVSPT